MSNVIAQRIKDFLKDYPPFSSMQGEQLGQLVQQIKVRYLESASLLFQEGEQPHEVFYVVREGAVGIEKRLGTTTILIDLCDEGDVFGLRPIVQQDHYRMQAVTREDTILYAVDIAAMLAITAENQEVMAFLEASYAVKYANQELQPIGGPGRKSFRAEDPERWDDPMPVSAHRNPVSCTAETLIFEAAKQMSEQKVGSIIVTQDQIPQGIITDKDLRVKIATGEVPIGAPVTSIMSAPVITAKQGISVSEAQIVMMRNKITHLCITQDGSPDSPLTGVISQRDVVAIRGNNPAVLLKEADRAPDIAGLNQLQGRTTSLLRRYLAQQASMAFITRLLPTVTDAITERAISLALAAMPEEPPVPFCWLALGSQGRQEQLLQTDQDNALVFGAVPPEQLADTRQYFLTLAQKVTRNLNEVGYEYCPADMMASNPRWCLSLPEWQQQFRRWISQPDEDSVMLSTIFFDFRPIFGHRELAHSLTEKLFEAIESFDLFLHYLARNAVLNPAPVGFFRQFLVEQDGAHKDQFDLKARALMPLIDAARVLVLSHRYTGLPATRDRYQALCELEPQNQATYQACLEAFDQLLKFRTEQGLASGDSGRYMPLDALSKQERLKLKACFSPINDIQDALKQRFQLARML